MKHNYQTPDTKVVELNSEALLVTVSNGGEKDGNWHSQSRKRYFDDEEEEEW